MFDEILYITRGNRSTIIQYSNSIQEINVTLDNYLNSLCLKELTTFKGRLEAIKNNYHLIKNVPIYINSKIVLFTTNNIKSFDNIYINSIYINDILYIYLQQSCMPHVQTAQCVLK